MEHAVVIGGSIGGLMAARVLADHFKRVTLIERDYFPAVFENRRGVPQGRHTHGLLAGGYEVFEQKFPGIAQELLDAGAVPADVARDGRWFQEGAALVQFKSGLDGVLMTRPLLEGVIRRRVLTLANVTARENSVVESLVTDGARTTVTGVVVNGETISADLVIDASGRGSHAPQWLEALGYAKPEEDRVEISVGYTTRFFRRRRDHLSGNLLAIVPATPEGKRCGVCVAQEGGRWSVTLAGYFGNYAPTDLEGFIEFARLLPVSDIYDVIRDAEPIGEPSAARYPASVRRRYESLHRFPAGLLVFGDAICSFNPIYGQGMSASALEAVELDKALASGPAALAQRFFARAAKVIDIPWDIVIGGDLRIPETVGPRSAKVNIINWYLSKLHKAAHHDQEVALAFHKVANLLAPPPSVMHPRIVARVIRHSLFGRRSNTDPAFTPAAVV